MRDKKFCHSVCELKPIQRKSLGPSRSAPSDISTFPAAPNHGSPETGTGGGCWLELPQPVLNSSSNIVMAIRIALGIAFEQQTVLRQAPMTLAPVRRFPFAGEQQDSDTATRSVRRVQTGKRQISAAASRGKNWWRLGSARLLRYPRPLPLDQPSSQIHVLASLRPHGLYPLATVRHVRPM